MNNKQTNETPSAAADKPAHCKLHGYTHRYKICDWCGGQYCTLYWGDCPRCNRYAPIIAKGASSNPLDSLGAKGAR